MRSVFVQRVNPSKLVGLIAVGAAILAGAGTQRLAAQTTPAASPASAPAAPTQTPAAPQPATTVTTAPQGGSIKGAVSASGVPLPGVAVTATNTLTGKKYATTTDIDGNFQMAVPRNGRYVVKTELAGFASTTQEVVINAASQNGGLPIQTAAFKMDLASRVTPETSTAEASTASAAPRGAGTPTGTTQRAVSRVGRGTQALSVQGNDNADTADATAGQGNTGVQLPSLGDISTEDSSAANESIAVSGNQGQINGLAGFSEDDLRNRIQDMQRQGLNNGDIAGTLTGVMSSGSFGGPGGGGFGGPGGGGPGGGGPGGGGFGGRGGGGGGGRFGGGGFGGFRGQNPNAWHGTVAYTGADSALNADNFSTTGRSLPKPQSDRNTLIASFTGTPYIPHLTTPNPKQFVFLSVQETRNTSPSVVQAIVPTLAQRYGDLTGAGTVYDPKTGQPYGNTNCNPLLATVDASPTACIPANEITPAGTALINYYPLPNITPLGTLDNYQANINGTSHSSQVSARYNRSFGSAPVRGGRGGFGGGGGRGGGGQNRNLPPTLRQSIAENFAYSHSAGANNSFSPTLGGSTVSNGYNFTTSYTVGYGRLNNSATAGWNRSRSLASNYFTNGTLNPALAAGIPVGNSTIDSNPFYYGLPSVGLTDFSGLSDQAPSNVVNQTLTFSDFVSYSHKRHNMRYGLDFHRIHYDSIGTGGDLGSFTFSGFSTESPLAQQCNALTDPQGCKEYGATGSPVADLLIGLPQQTGITAGLGKIYLRGNSWDWYVQDDWRAKPNFTISYGLRWEYFSPYAEKYGHLVNLNLTGSGSTLGITNVCAAAAPGVTGTTNCTTVSPGSTLVHPDKADYSPRVAIAWSPKFKFTKNTVVRSGYGINYNTGQYSRFATLMAFQQPFALTQTNTISTPASPTSCNFSNMTLTHGFNCSTQSVQSNYGVDPNYRLGMVQVYNLGIQRTLPQGIVMNIDYTGAYSGNLDIVRAPNRTFDGVLNPNSVVFRYEDSLGYQRSNALAFNIRNRMHKGVALSATYTYSHSIDDASSVGGTSATIAQNDQDLGAEESNSSFDRRHVLNGNFVIEPPFGPNRAFFNKGNVTSKILDGFNVSGTFTFSTGGWATPTFVGLPSEVATGFSTLRPNRIPGTSISGPGTEKEWFNTAAFDTSTPTGYGNSTRNSIELPGTVSINGSLSRTISMGETRSLELRMTANNVFNTVQYSGINTSIPQPCSTSGTQTCSTFASQNTFGQVTSAAAMRSLSYIARFRF
jgi:hypothetical protein